MTWKATDHSGNSANDTQYVTISTTADKTLPVISVTSPTSGAKIFGPPSGATVNVTGKASDVGSGVKIVEVRGSSGNYISATPKAPHDWSTWKSSVVIKQNGTNTITARVTDYFGNQQWASIPITVTLGNGLPNGQDTTPPSITAPADVTAEATGTLTTISLGKPTVHDNVDPSPVVSNNAAGGGGEGAGFPVGTTTVTWTATDQSGNSATATQKVTIKDTTPPSITAPANVTATATGNKTQVSLGTPTVTDNADPSPTVTNDAPSAGFPVGTTIVTWKATDHSGNSATATQKVTIHSDPDTTPPSITAPANVTAAATGNKTQVSLGTPTVHDNVDPSPTVTNDAPSAGFPVGTTIVTWKATDHSGNSATATQKVTINPQDTSPPSIAAPADVTVEGNGTLTKVSLGTPTVTDNADPSPTVTNDAPSAGFPVGTTTVAWKATDHSGNSATATQKVTVTKATPPMYLSVLRLVVPQYPDHQLERQLM